MLASIFLIFVPIACADTLAQKIAAQVEASPVYIDSSIADAAGDTQHILSRLKPDDGIVVVILAENAVPDPAEFANELMQALATPRTIALTVGQTTTVQSAEWPSQIVASDIMRRSLNVSTNPVDTMLTFVREVHGWQDRNPKPVPPAPPAEPTDPATYILPIGGVAILAVGIGGTALLIKRRNARMLELYGAPRRYRRALSRILKYRDKYGADTAIGRDLTSICQGAVKYFRGQTRDDAPILHQHLKNVAKVMQGYDEVRTSSGDYRNAGELTKNGESTIHEFNEFVSEVVRKGNAIKAGDFELNLATLRDARNSTILE